jgi:hypothetical protein
MKWQKDKQKKERNQQKNLEKKPKKASITNTDDGMRLWGIKDDADKHTIKKYLEIVNSIRMLKKDN